MYNMVQLLIVSALHGMVKEEEAVISFSVSFACCLVLIAYIAQVTFVLKLETVNYGQN